MSLLASRLAPRIVEEDGAFRTRMLTVAAGMSNVIALGRGDPDFHTPAHIVAAAKAAIDANHHHYTGPTGLPPLRAAIAADLKAAHGLDYAADEIVVTAGAQEAVMLTMLGLCTRGDEVLRRWAEGLGLPFIGAIRETQGYVRCVEQGLSLFDMPTAKVQTDLDQWQPILDWLQTVLYPVAGAAAPATATPSRAMRPLPAARPVASRPQSAQVPADVLEGPGRRDGLAARLGGWLDAWPLRRLLQRDL